MLELFAAAMARDSSNPPLLVRSERGTPMWMSPLEILKLSIGLADFTCCQRNHVITTETQKVMNGGEVKKIPCDKPIAGGILEQLIDAKINHLFNALEKRTDGEASLDFKHWWMRGLKKMRKIFGDENESAVAKFKNTLRWDTDDSWFDHGVLVWSCMLSQAMRLRLFENYLKNLKRNFEGEEYYRRLRSRVRDKGYIALGIPGGTTTLMAAMMMASTEVVSMLLESGANVESVDVMGNDAFTFASTLDGRRICSVGLRDARTTTLESAKFVLGATPLIAATIWVRIRLKQ